MYINIEENKKDIINIKINNEKLNKYNESKFNLKLQETEVNLEFKIYQLRYDTLTQEEIEKYDKYFYEQHLYIEGAKWQLDNYNEYY